MSEDTPDFLDDNDAGWADACCGRTPECKEAWPEHKKRCRREGSKRLAYAVTRRATIDDDGLALAQERGSQRPGLRVKSGCAARDEPKPVTDLKAQIEEGSRLGICRQPVANPGSRGWRQVKHRRQVAPEIHKPDLLR